MMMTNYVRLIEVQNCHQFDCYILKRQNYDKIGHPLVLLDIKNDTKLSLNCKTDVRYPVLYVFDAVDVKHIHNMCIGRQCRQQVASL